MELLNYRDYRSYLKSVLEERIAKNSRYSLRAFARDLEISPQMLSYVLTLKKGVSTELAAQIANRLELNPSESSFFIDLVTLTHARSPEVRKLAEYRIEERLSSGPVFKSLEVEAFKVISDWYHYAILELSFTENFLSDPKAISERLGISVFEVKQALERLEKLELLERNSKGRLKKSASNVSAIHGVPSSALRKHARQVLQKAIESLESQNLEERDITSITMAIDPSLIPEAKQMIAKFRRKLCAFLEQGHRTEVYSFAPSLFRLTTTKKGK